MDTFLKSNESLFLTLSLPPGPRSLAGHVLAPLTISLILAKWVPGPVGLGWAGLGLRLSASPEPGHKSPIYHLPTLSAGLLFTFKWRRGLTLSPGNVSWEEVATARVIQIEDEVSRFIISFGLFSWRLYYIPKKYGFKHSRNPQWNSVPLEEQKYEPLLNLFKRAESLLNYGYCRMFETLFWRDPQLLFP